MSGFVLTMTVLNIELVDFYWLLVGNAVVQCHSICSTVVFEILVSVSGHHEGIEAGVETSQPFI